MIEVYKDGELIGKFNTVAEAMEFANADAEINDHGKVKWTEVK